MGNIAVVQHGSAVATVTSGKSVAATVNLPQNISRGNTLVGFAGIATGTNNNVANSGLTTNGAADNWQYVDNELAYYYADWPLSFAAIDPDTAGGTNTIDFAATLYTAATTSNSALVLVDVFEVAGLGPYSALDASTWFADSASGLTWTSDSFPAAASAADQVILFGSVFLGADAANTTAVVTGPGSGWQNQAILSAALQQGGTGTTHLYNMYQLSGWNNIGTAGSTQLVYSGTSSQTQDWVAWGISLYSGVRAAGQSPAVATPPAYYPSVAGPVARPVSTANPAPSAETASGADTGSGADTSSLAVSDTDSGTGTDAGVSIALPGPTLDEQIALDSPSAWWKLADTLGASSAADSSGNGWTGTPSNVTFGESSSPSPPDTSASFNGSSSGITTSYNPALSAVTIEAWVNLDGQSQGGHNPRLLANGHSDATNLGFQLWVNNGTEAECCFGNGSTFLIVSGGTVTASGWNQLAATWDGTTVRLYLNGYQTATGSLSGTLVAG